MATETNYKHKAVTKKITKNKRRKKRKNNRHQDIVIPKRYITVFFEKLFGFLFYLFTLISIIVIIIFFIMRLFFI